jgi:peroxisomal membrane protein 4
MQICKHESTCLSSAIRGARNGLYYGAKIRCLHALVMTFLFKKGSLKEKMANILQLTWEHARNLGVFVFFYKLAVCVQNRLVGSPLKVHSLTAGALVGYLVFKKKT